MSDFESTFGAGADAVSIIDGLSRETLSDDDILSGGADIPIAAGMYERSGRVWFPKDAPENVLDDVRLLKFSDMAKKVAARCTPDYLQECLWDQQHSWPILEDILQEIGPFVSENCRDLDEIEAFLRLLTRNMPIPAALVRDTGPFNGMVGIDLSSHALILSDGWFLARFGGEQIVGPFRELDQNSYLCFPDNAFVSLANYREGQEVIEVSAGAVDGLAADLGLQAAMIEDPRALWLSSNRDVEADYSFQFELISDRASSFEGRGRIRNWTDAREKRLIERVGLIIRALRPEGYDGMVTLRVGVSGAHIAASYTGDLVDDAMHAALDCFVNLSGMRGRGWNGGIEIELYNWGNHDATRPDCGARMAFLDIAEDSGLDRLLVQSCLDHQDWGTLSHLISRRTKSISASNT